MEQWLRIGDTVFTESYAIQSGEVLWVYIYAKIDLGEVFAILNDSEKTKEISVLQAGETTTHTGFTELFCVRKENEGFITAGLRKGRAG